MGLESVSTSMDVNGESQQQGNVKLLLSVLFASSFDPGRGAWTTVFLLLGWVRPNVQYTDTAWLPPSHQPRLSGEAASRDR